MIFAVAFLIALLVTYLFTPLVKNAAEYFNLVDKPNQRKINKVPVPNIGGIAIYLGFILTVLIFSSFDRTIAGIITGGSFILLLGFLDDLYELSPAMKLMGQIIAAVILVFFGIRIDFITHPFGGMIYLGYWGTILTILWVVTITNTINLIDGLDGLAGGISTIAAFTLFFVALQEGRYSAALLAVAIAGGSLGFLKYNFYPAVIFMGDSGSMFSGYILAAISIIGALKSAAAVTVFVPLLALAIPLFDTAFAIIRRLYNNRPISKADQGHIHHRLLALGWSQKQAVILVYVVSILLGAMALVINGSNLQNALILLGLIIPCLLILAWKIGLFTVEIQGDKTTIEKNKILKEYDV